MKIEKLKSLILKPLLAGLLALAVGGGLFIYYYFYVDNPSAANYVITGAIAVMGLLAIASTIFFYIRYLMRVNIKKKGEQAKAIYVSHSTNVSAAKVNYYKITFKYELNNEEHIVTSNSEFEWKEVLTIKAVNEVNIKVLNGKVVIDDDLEALYENNKDLVKAQQQLYDDAYKKVDELNNLK